MPVSTIIEREIGVTGPFLIVNERLLNKMLAYMPER
jgi:hypothetical protein